VANRYIITKRKIKEENFVCLLKTNNYICNGKYHLLSDIINYVFNISFMLMKRVWKSPETKIQKFVPNHSVAACNNTTTTYWGIPTSEVHLNTNGEAYKDNGNGVYDSGDTSVGGVRMTYAAHNTKIINGVEYLIVDSNFFRGHVTGYSGGNVTLENIWLVYAMNNYQSHSGGDDWHVENWAPYACKGEPIKIVNAS